MPDETQTAGEQFSSTKKIMIIIVGILVIAIAVALWMILKPFSPSEPNQPANEQPPSSLTDQAGWEVFVNPKYGYAFKYPTAWTIDKSNAEKDSANDVASEVILSSKPDPLVLLKTSNPPADLSMMTFAVNKVSLETSVAQFIKDKKYGAALSQAPVIFADISGEQLLYVYTRPDKREVLNIITILKQGDKMYVFSYNSFKPDKEKLPQEVETIHDEILSSFSLK